MRKLPIAAAIACASTLLLRPMPMRDPVKTGRGISPSSARSRRHIASDLTTWGRHALTAADDASMQANATCAAAVPAPPPTFAGLPASSWAPGITMSPCNH